MAISFPPSVQKKKKKERKQMFPFLPSYLFSPFSLSAVFSGNK
jgi:hypothetical protein